LLDQDPNTGDLFRISSSFRVEVLIQGSPQSLFTGDWLIDDPGEPHANAGPGTMGSDQDARAVTTKVLNLQNLRGQTLLFRCLDTGFITTAPAQTRYQKARGVDPARRGLVGERPANWIKEVPLTTCEHCGMGVRRNQ